MAKHVSAPPRIEVDLSTKSKEMSKNNYEEEKMDKVEEMNLMDKNLLEFP